MAKPHLTGGAFALTIIRKDTRERILLYSICNYLTLFVEKFPFVFFFLSNYDDAIQLRFRRRNWHEVFFKAENFM
jgi:hypothetical protein